MEPGAGCEEGAVQRGGRGQEGRAGDEHASRQRQERQAQPGNIHAELMQHSAIEIYLIIKQLHNLYQLSLDPCRKTDT